MAASLIFLVAALASPALAAYFDLSRDDAGLLYPCPPGDLGFLARPAGDWEVFDLSDLIVPSAGNPVMGKVLTNGLYERSCFRSPDYFEVHSNFTFQTQMFLSKATNTPTFYVWLVNDKEEAHLIHKEEKFNEEGWHFYDIPIDTSSPGLELPGKYLLEFWTTLDVQTYAMRWVGLSDEKLPPNATRN